jgi:L-threonylcarbamoyladenylate synthase
VWVRYRRGVETGKSNIIAADVAGIATAAQVLAAGGIVAVPTETVYGLAARASDPAAIATIYAAKGRPSFNPLIVHVLDVAQAETLATFGPLARRLAEAFWPGPLTLVVPRRPGAALAPAISAGLETVALRCPAHPVMRALIATVGPLAAPSANASGHISPTLAQHVADSLGERAPLILDAGACAAGLESTIVRADAESVTVLRQGGVTVEALAAVLAPAPVLVAGEKAAISAPGMMASHYAPRQPVRLEAKTAHADEFHIGFGPIHGDVNLSATGDLAEAAAGLFAALHAAEASGRAGIAVAPIPSTGLGAAINDRLARAAAERGAENSGAGSS